MDDSTINGPSPAPAAPNYVPPTKEKKAFLAALAAAQGEYLPLEKNKHVRIEKKAGGSYEFDYADLSAINDATRAALSKNGISTRHKFSQVDGETGWLESIVGHAEGYEDISVLPVVLTAEDIKTVGARIRYIRRYLLEAQLGVSAGDDIDEDGKERVGDVSSGASVTETPRGKNGPARRSDRPEQPERRAAARSTSVVVEPPPEGYASREEALAASQGAAAAAASPSEAQAIAHTQRKAAVEKAERETKPTPEAQAEADRHRQDIAAAARERLSQGDKANEQFLDQQHGGNGGNSEPELPGVEKVAKPAEPMAEEGQVNYLCKRATQRNVVLASVFQELGFTGLSTDPKALLGKLTLAQWKAAMTKV